MKRVIRTGLVAGCLLAAILPGWASAAGGGPPEALFGICQGRGTGGADPIVSQDPGAGYGPWVVFDLANQDWRTPLGTAQVFTGAGACPFNQPAR
jgi:hypothetical protein